MIWGLIVNRPLVTRHTLLLSKIYIFATVVFEEKDLFINTKQLAFLGDVK